MSYLARIFPWEDYSHDGSLFLIRLGTDTSSFGVRTPIHMLDDKTDRLEIIDNLLRLRGDTRLCGVPMMSYNPSKSSLREFETRRYSIQLEALFFINMIYFENNFPFYSDVPCVSSLDGSKQETLEGELINEAFDCYESWFQKVKRMGWEKAKHETLQPLNGCDVKWCN
jgi:hypothetical protein